ncbi:hypothetical protein EDB19DRAFT_1727489 [Suillus lakei]|nr:hypothetical protein EDB19DRAFT_1727489 [Suillus lakei]
MLAPSKSQSSTTRSNTMHYQASSPNHPAQATVGPWTSGDPSSSTDHNCRMFTQGQYPTQSVSTFDPQAFVIPQPQSVYPYPTTTNSPASVPNYVSWHNTPTHNTTQSYNPALGGASIWHSSSPAMGDDYSSPSTLQNMHPNDGYPSRSTISSQYTVANHDTPLVVGPDMATSGFSPYNISSHQWQNPPVPQPGSLSPPLTPVIPPPLTAEPSRFIFVNQPRASRGDHIGYSNQPPINQPYSSPLHSYPSSPLPSCQWLNDDTVTPCGFIGTLDALKVHCTTSHFTGPRMVQIECQWEGCSYYKRDEPAVRVMRRDCIWRHICEVHLMLKRST